jgi:lysophospholipase L1-like esterase
VAADAGSGVSRSVIGVGDSTLYNSQPLTTLVAENSSDVMTVTFKGTQGDSIKQEGRSGWKISDFVTVGRTLYKYVVSGITIPPGIGTIYSDGTNQFTISEINITEGSGYFTASRTSGTGTSTSSGTLTKISGTGDDSITYSSTSSISGNPFWNDSTSELDFAGYLTDNSITMASGDWIFIHLGINDVFNQTSDSALLPLIDTMVTQLRALITNMRSAVSGLRVALCITIMPTPSQDGFGANYTTGQSLYRYLQNIRTWQKRMITEFDNDTERIAGNYLIAWNAVVDRDNNMTISTTNANARNTTQITTYTNGVHPAQSGYDQMGDQLWAFLKYMA